MKIFRLLRKFINTYLIVHFTGPENGKVINWLEVSQMID